MNEHARKAWNQVRQKLPYAREGFVTSVFDVVWRARGEADKGAVGDTAISDDATFVAAINAIAELDQPFKE